MKNVTKFFMVALLAGMCSLGYAQTTYEWKKSPKPTEIVIGGVSMSYDGGYRQTKINNGDYVGGNFKNYSDEELYAKLVETTRVKYGETYPKFALRNFKSTCRHWDETKSVTYVTNRAYDVSATVVIPDPVTEANEKLSQAIDKAFRNVRQGSRIAIDQVTVWSGLNREDYKDQLIDVLLDKGYKVVAKEYLEKLYEEQQAQQSGIYNDKTTVQENNFSAVGYYINVKVTETSLRVQVVNVSTGEYEGNATVNF